MKRLVAISLVAVAAATAPAHAASQHATLGLVLAEYTRLAGAAGASARGQDLLERLNLVSTASASTASPVDHLALENWLGQSCQQALARPCNVQEKADVTAWLLRRAR